MVARCCKPGPLDQERHCHATTPGTISAQRGAELKRQDQLGQAGKRKHFDGSEWKKKCSNFTKCGKPNEQLSRYNQTLLLAFILQTSEGLEVSFQRACRSQLRIGCYIAGMFSPHYFSKVKRAYQDRLDMKTLATIHQELLTGRVCR